MILPKELLILTPLIIGWFIASVVLYIAGRMAAGEEATLGESFLIALLGPFIIGITILFTGIILNSMWSLLIALFVWTWIIKSVYDVGWGASLLISISAAFTLIVVAIVSSILLGISYLELLY